MPVPALVERPTVPPLQSDDLDLIKRTVASGATDTELKLFLYDCQRRGIHPLDKLLHFTKRGGRYTPVTSIDFMRAQAAVTGEMAGSEDAVFVNGADGRPESATVTVYRLTAGQRFAYTATARWAEYCPDNAPMWKRMPHTMLGKCAEALALRKAFPQQLAGLYSREEMDQADKGSALVVEAPAGAAAVLPTSDARPEGDAGQLSADGALRISRVETRPTSNKNVTKYVIVLSDGREVTTIKQQLSALAEACCQAGDPVTVETKQSRWGEDLVSLHRAERVIQLRADEVREPGADDDLAF